MSKTALVWLTLYAGSLFGSFLNPTYGLMGIMTEYYRRPVLQWWGDELPRLRWNFIVTTVFAVTVLMKFSDARPLERIDKSTKFWWTAFAINLWLVALILPYDRARAYEFAVYWSKVAILMPLLLLAVLRTRKAIDLFIFANVIGVGVWGWDAYMAPRREASRLVNVGSSDTLDDNSAAVHLILMMPLITAMILNAGDKIRRIVSVISLPLTINTFILCNSRGATVGLASALWLVPFLAKKGHRLRSLGVGVAVAGEVDERPRPSRGQKRVSELAM